MERKVELNNYIRNIGNAYKNIISLSKLQKEEKYNITIYIYIYLYII